MPQKGYRSVTIHEELLKRIENYLLNNPDSGVRSVTEFVVDSIRRRIEELEAIELKRKEVENYATLAENKKRYRP